MMKKFMKKLWEKKDSKKGFTLVELIVVLVILAILMAILVPSLLGWIDKAKEKQVMLNARTVVMAAGSAQAEAYGEPTSRIMTKEEVEKYLGDDFKGEWWITVSKDLKTVTEVYYADGDTVVKYTSDGKYVSEGVTKPSDTSGTITQAAS